ncbi:hypothetical protein evm_005876 [Chilo suppressalis]|nr:hypothetical protein evm_005876 [Chilo suppressalis]
MAGVAGRTALPAIFASGLHRHLSSRLDTREGRPSHWSDSNTLGARASFRSDTKPAVLVLTKLRPEDSGQYRCRVDFIKSPTKNTRLNLTVLSPYPVKTRQYSCTSHPTRILNPLRFEWSRGSRRSGDSLRGEMPSAWNTSSGTRQSSA